VTRWVFTDATALDAIAGARPRQTVVVEGERIVAVDGGPPPPAQPGERRVDLAGRTLMPGLITCHFHSTYHELGRSPAPLGLDQPPAYLALRAARNFETALLAGCTGAVSAGCAHDIDAACKQAIDDGLIRGPRLLAGSRDLSTTGHANDSTPWYWKLRAAPAIRLCDGADGFRRGVREEIKRGADIIKLFVTGGHGTRAPQERAEMTRAELAAAVEAAHARGRRIRGHIANKAAILMAIDAGIDVIDHADAMDAECIDRLATAQTFVVPSLLFPDTLAAQQGPALGFTASMRADVERMCGVLPAANAAGVKLLIGDDYGAIGLPHGRYAAELALYVERAGIAPLDVLRWATVNGAELLGLGEQLGRVAPGQLADLLAVDGDPLADIRILQDLDRLSIILKGGVAVKDAWQTAR
jgi:imidazolonepropionase-like amidohydrolase